MENNIYYVYLHRRNDTNEVFYVGKGKNNRAARTYGRNKWWHNVVNKAGGFTIEYVEKGMSEENSLDLEIELIKFYRECGHTLCNLTDGGEGVSGYIATEETRRKLSERLKGHTFNRGRKLSEETKKLLSDINKGKKLSPETCQKMSDSQKGRVNCPIHLERIQKANRKPVRCSNGMVFDSAVDAGKWLNSIGFEKASGLSVAECARGRRKKAYGFYWEYIQKESPEGLLLYHVEPYTSSRILENAVVLSSSP